MDADPWNPSVGHNISSKYVQMIFATRESLHGLVLEFLRAHVVDMLLLVLELDR